MLTKHDERDLVAKTIAALPDSYLRDILTTERDSIIRAIDDDLTFLDLAELGRQIIAEREALRAVRAEIMEAQKTLRETHQHQSRLDDSIREIRTTARRMAAC